MALTISDSDLLVIEVKDGEAVGYPMTYSNWRLNNPQTSFPELPSNNFLADYGYAVFKYVERPAPVPFENTNEGPYVWNASSGGAWSNSWVQVPFTPAEMDAARAQATGALVMQKNNRLLASDYTMLPDVPLTDAKRSEWVAYRAALRAYMDTVTDPFNPPAWPTPPQA